MQFQSALRTRVRSDLYPCRNRSATRVFQSALRTRVRSDLRPDSRNADRSMFQSALRTRVRSDLVLNLGKLLIWMFQSALRTRVRSDTIQMPVDRRYHRVSIRAPHSRAERPHRRQRQTCCPPCFNPRSALACGATQAAARAVDLPRHVSIRAPHSRAERPAGALIGLDAPNEFQSALRTRVRSDVAG